MHAHCPAAAGCGAPARPSAPAPVPLPARIPLPAHRRALQQYTALRGCFPPGPRSAPCLRAGTRHGWHSLRPRQKALLHSSATSSRWRGRRYCAARTARSQEDHGQGPRLCPGKIPRPERSCGQDARRACRSTHPPGSDNRAPPAPVHHKKTRRPQGSGGNPDTPAAPCSVPDRPERR